MAFALTRSWICSATGSTAKDFASCFPAHSSQGVGENFDFVVGKSVLRLFEEFGDLVGIAAVVESEDGRQVGVVGVFVLWSFAEPPVGGDAGGRVVSSSGVVVAVVLDFGGLGGAVVLCHR